MFFFNTVFPILPALIALLFGLPPLQTPTPAPAPAPIVIDEPTEPDMYSGYRYKQIDDTTLEVSFWHPNGCPPLLDTIVSETHDTVTITFVEVPADPNEEQLMCHQAFIEVFSTVNLDSPLGDRNVIIEGPLTQGA
ncbi:hypothetical protein [Corynebacterium cystitidis]|uniref:hypothetical protein n=1 Tax=Corynebacterium cystitidis TaxID=35757 RepID=UPI00211E4DC3|nr:hypothetical protein [Corynebacterium cystitidis]